MFFLCKLHKKTVIENWCTRSISISPEPIILYSSILFILYFLFSLWGKSILPFLNPGLNFTIQIFFLTVYNISEKSITFIGALQYVFKTTGYITYTQSRNQEKEIILANKKVRDNILYISRSICDTKRSHCVHRNIEH